MSLISRLERHLVRRRRRYFLLLLVLILGAKIMQWAGEWEAQRLECVNVALPADALPGCGRLRIALITDVHNAPHLFHQAIAMVREAKPDLIIFGGDLVSAHERFMRTRWAVEGFRQLKDIAPCYAILGNHDYEKLEQVERVYATAGITLLRNETTDWETPSGAPIKIVGLGDWNEGDEAPAACMKTVGQEKMPVLLLSHDPESRWLLRRHDWDLMLSGHTHAGQLGNPFSGKYISLRSSMPAGLFDFENGRKVYVSRGVGSILRMRFFCRPEVSILDIGG